MLSLSFYLWSGLFYLFSIVFVLINSLFSGWQMKDSSKSFVSLNIDSSSMGRRLSSPMAAFAKEDKERASEANDLETQPLLSRNNEEEEEKSNMVPPPPVGRSITRAIVREKRIRKKQSQGVLKEKEDDDEGGGVALSERNEEEKEAEIISAFRKAVEQMKREMNARMDEMAEKMIENLKKKK